MTTILMEASEHSQSGEKYHDRAAYLLALVSAASGVLAVTHYDDSLSSTEQFAQTD